MDEDTRHVLNLGECKKVHAYKESFYCGFKMKFDNFSKKSDCL
ncbi:hypothetical protein ABH964_003840 [Bacillus sp. RC92]